MHNYEITPDEAINNQKDLNILINKLNNDYEPRNTEKIEEKKRVLKSGRTLQNARKDINDELVNVINSGLKDLKRKIKKMSEEEK